MRILLNTRGILRCNRQTQTLKTNLSSFLPLTVAEYFTVSKYYSIFASKSFANHLFNPIFHRKISFTCVKSERNRDLSKRIDTVGESIYHGQLTWRIRRIRLISFAMVSYGIYSQPFLWEESQLFSDTGLTVLDSLSIPGAIAIMIPILIHSRMKSVVLDIRYNKETDEYNCATASIFSLKNKTKFKVEDIYYTENEDMFTLMKIRPKKIPLLIEAASFTDPEHYSRFLGYDTRTKGTIADGESIYSSEYTSKIVWLKLFSYGIIISGIMVQPMLWQTWGVLGCSIGAVFAITLPISANFLVKNHVLDIRYKKETDEYTCTTNPVFSLKNKIKFKVEDIHNLEIESVFTSMKVGPQKVPLFIDKTNFTNRRHYARLMGYDKPFDIDTHFNLLVDVKRKSLEAGTHQIPYEHGSTNTESKKKEQRI